ncbi:hypothetical protein, partial [Serratia bockelmannii]
MWHGRAAAEGRPGIVGLNGYIAQMGVEAVHRVAGAGAHVGAV